MQLKSYQVPNTVYKVPCLAAEPDDGIVRIVLLSLHGFASSKDSSINQALREEMTKRQTAMVSFDWPAHGESETEDAQLTVENCRQEVLAVAADIRKRYPQAEKLTVMGTSFGGYILLQCMDEFPDAEIILRAPALNMAEISLMIAHTPETFLTEGSTFGYTRPMRLTGAFYEDLKYHDVRTLTTDRKMTVLCGTEDELIPCELTKEFAKRNVGVELHVMEGCVHRLKRECDTEYVVEVVKRVCEGRQLN